MWYRCKLTKEHVLSSFTLSRTSSRVVSTLPELSRSRPLHPSRLQIQSKRWALGKFCQKLSHSQPLLSISIPCTYETHDLKQLLSLVWKHSLGIQLSAAPLCSNSWPRDLASTKSASSWLEHRAVSVTYHLLHNLCSWIITWTFIRMQDAPDITRSSWWKVMSHDTWTVWKSWEKTGKSSFPIAEMSGKSIDPSEPLPGWYPRPAAWPNEWVTSRITSFCWNFGHCFCLRSDGIED